MTLGDLGLGTEVETESVAGPRCTYIVNPSLGTETLASPLLGGTCFDGAIVSRLRTGAKLAEHLVHGVDDLLWLIQLNLVT